MKSTFAWLLAAGVAAGAAVVVFGLRKPATPPPAPEKTQAAVVEFLPTDLWTVKAEPLKRTLPITGTLRAANQTVVKTRVAGDLVQLLVREGESVRAGQIVARIETTEYEWRVRREEASLAASQAQLDMAARTRANNAQLLAKGFISQNAFDSAQSGMEAAAASRDAAAAALEIARKSLADTVIRSPMTATVAERFAQPGEKLPVDGRVLSLVDLASIELEAPVPADNIARVAAGQRAVFRPEGAARELSGTVRRISPTTASGSRSVLVYIGVDRPDPALRAGMFAHGHLELEASAPVLAVPASALHEEGGASGVLALVDGRIARFGVQTGARGMSANDVEMVEVRGPLTAGMHVVRRFDPRLASGASAAVSASPAATR
jgi:RND family efflux transporter MFP subunit